MNAILDKIQSASLNKEAFAPILGDGYAKFRAVNSKKDDKDEFQSKHSKAFKYTAAGIGITALSLGSVGLFLGRGKYNKIRQVIFDNVETFGKKAGKATHSAHEGLKKVGGYFFNAEVIKNSTIGQFFERGLGWIGGGWVVKVSKWSGGITKKSAQRIWNGSLGNGGIKAYRPYIEEAAQSLYAFYSVVDQRDEAFIRNITSNNSPPSHTIYAIRAVVGSDVAGND